MNNSVWIGGRKIVESPNSPRVTNSGDARTWTRTWKGPYDQLEKQMPLIGDKPSDMRVTGLYVSDATLEHAEAESGILSVTLTQPVRTSKRKCVWTPVRKDIRSHPLFSTLTPEMRKRIAAAFSDGDEWLESDAWKDDNGSLETDPNGNSYFHLAEKLLEKLLKGEDSYDIFVPVVTLITYSDVPTSNSGALLNTVGRPPSIARAPTTNKRTGQDWIYIQTGDEDADLDDGGVERTQEWTGCEDYDPDLYKESHPHTGIQL